MVTASASRESHPPAKHGLCISGNWDVPYLSVNSPELIYRPLFGKDWLSSICWSPSAKTGSELERMVGKNAGPILSHLWTKVRVVLRGDLS